MTQQKTPQTEEINIGRLMTPEQLKKYNETVKTLHSDMEQKTMTQLQKLIDEGKELLSCSCEKCFDARLKGDIKAKYQYNFSPDQLQAILDLHGKEQREICADNAKIIILNAPPPNTGL